MNRLLLCILCWNALAVSSRGQLVSPGAFHRLVGRDANYAILGENSPAQGLFVDAADPKLRLTGNLAPGKHLLALDFEAKINDNRFTLFSGNKFSSAFSLGARFYLLLGKNTYSYAAAPEDTALIRLAARLQRDSVNAKKQDKYYLGLLLWAAYGIPVTGLPQPSPQADWEAIVVVRPERAAQLAAKHFDYKKEIYPDFKALLLGLLLRKDSALVCKNPSALMAEYQSLGDFDNRDLTLAECKQKQAELHARQQPLLLAKRNLENKKSQKSVDWDELEQIDRELQTVNQALQAMQAEVAAVDLRVKSLEEDKKLQGILHETELNMAERFWTVKRLNWLSFEGRGAYKDFVVYDSVRLDIQNVQRWGASCSFYYNRLILNYKQKNSLFFRIGGGYVLGNNIEGREQLEYKTLKTYGSASPQASFTREVKGMAYNMGFQSPLYSSSLCLQSELYVLVLEGRAYRPGVYLSARWDRILQGARPVGDLFLELGPVLNAESKDQTKAYVSLVPYVGFYELTNREQKNKLRFGLKIGLPFRLNARSFSKK